MSTYYFPLKKKKGAENTFYPLQLYLKFNEKER